MDELVRPEAPITDYVTRYSGITAAMMAGVTTSLADVQVSLEHDRTQHPCQFCRHTSRICCLYARIHPDPHWPCPGLQA